VRRVLVVAAEKFELEHISAREGWILTANGPGPRLAGEAVDRISGTLDAIVSTGLCGALDPGLSVGEIFVATDVNGMPARKPSTSRPCEWGTVASVDRVACTAGEKRCLSAGGARVVEMEAAAVAARAQTRGADFYCVRAVSDIADETFALDWNAARGSDGRFSVWRILGEAARRPRTGVPELMRLRRNAAVATRALGEFFADCEF
jgi:hypothetical protein